MKQTSKDVTPRYQKIAIDIAAKIVDKQYSVGEKIYARSSLASSYSVSAETARKAIALLSDHGVVETTKGSGVIIKSMDNAILFLRKHQNSSTLAALKQDALLQTSQLEAECLALKSTIERLVDKVGKFQNTNPFVPYETKVPSDSPCIGKTTSELAFWQHTAATIIAVRRNGELLVSPGPDITLQASDILYYIGGETCRTQVSALLLPQQTPSSL